jgi:hypothetical protein
MSPDDVLKAATPSPARLEALYTMVNEALVRRAASGGGPCVTIETSKFQGLELATVRLEYEKAGWMTKILSDQREGDYVQFTPRKA